ncbi:MAG TPA: hypothetical protein VFV80_14610 [Geminicoccaceae bacterium]|nr:hypothetical protein [Geminicoccaceae bacterium]
MLDAILAPTKGLLGKAYLISGLIPATILYVGWTWFWGGRRAIDALITSSTADTLLADTIVTLVSWLGLGLVFFYTRATLFQFFERLPIWLLRDLFVAAQLRKRRRARRRRTELVWLLSVARWHEQDYAQPKFVPESLLEPGWLRFRWSCLKRRSSSEDQAFEASCRGRTEFADLAKTERTALFRRCRLNRALDRLVVFYLYCYHQFKQAGHQAEDERRRIENRINREIAHWRKLTGDQSSLGLIGAVHDALHRRWLRARDAARLFPAERWVQPTAIGNIFASLDDYAEKRYKIDTSTLWSRLWWTLPAEVKDEVAQAKLGVETLINICVALLLLAVLIGLSAIVDDDASYRRIMIFVVATLCLARLAYMASQSSARALMAKMESAIDVYRLDLLRKIGFEPATIQEELALFEETRGFYEQAVPRNVTRPFGKASEKSAAGDGQGPHAGTSYMDMLLVVKEWRHGDGPERVDGAPDAHHP